MDAFDGIVAVGGRPAHESRIAELSRAFQERTGSFRPDEPWFEVRSRAFWDDALTRGGFAREALAELPPRLHAWAVALGRAHRGLFVTMPPSHGRRVLRDAWGGAEFFVDEIDEATQDALVAAAAPFDGRLVALGDPPRVALLPGAVFHPADAVQALEKVLDAAREQGLPADEVLDALLRMELSLRKLSRVKPAYAYRVEALR